jgi:hypothetical protein
MKLPRQETVQEDRFRHTLTLFLDGIGSEEAAEVTCDRHPRIV